MSWPDARDARHALDLIEMALEKLGPVKVSRPLRDRLSEIYGHLLDARRLLDPSADRPA